MSIISNITDLTGISSNEIALETVLSNDENVFGVPFHVNLNIATGCTGMYNKYGWFYNDTLFTFKWARVDYKAIGGWADFGNILGAIVQTDNLMTCPTSVSTLYRFQDVSTLDRVRNIGFAVDVPPGHKIWIGGIKRDYPPDGETDLGQGGSIISGVLYTKQP